MELQFYGPGYVPQFEGFGCTAHQYCAAMTIDSFNSDQNTGVPNTAACDNYLLGGVEPINWAYITRNGHSQAPANPLFTGTFDNPNLSAVTPNQAKDLFMNPGDRIRIHMHDTDAGLRIELSDLTTGQDGSMTASVANGFGHVLYTPTSSTCQAQPYAFHPEYSTANPRGNTWSAHTYNVAMSDEIGHFENCLAIDANFNCTTPGSQDSSGLDEDDGNNACVPAADSLVVKINGCFSSDADFDGQSYRNDWPGTFRDVGRDRALHPSPVLFTSPLANRTTNYSKVAFETDLPRIEAADSQDNPPFCDRTTGANCVNPPHGAQFYPIFTTSEQARHVHLAGRWTVHPRHEERPSEAPRPPSTGRCSRRCTPRPGARRSRATTTSTAATCATPVPQAEGSTDPDVMTGAERGPPPPPGPGRVPGAGLVPGPTSSLTSTPLPM